MLRGSSLRSSIISPILSSHLRRSPSTTKNPWKFLRPMSSSPAELVAKLPAPVQLLVQNASSHLVGNAAFGASDNDSKEISESLSIASGLNAQSQLSVGGANYYNGSGQDSPGTFLDRQEINSKLVGKTYLVGSTPSAADIALYGVLHPVVVRVSTFSWLASQYLNLALNTCSSFSCVHANSQN